MWAALGEVFGARYLIRMTTTPHRYTHLLMLKITEEAHQFCFDRIARINRNSKVSVKRIHTDNAKELLGMTKGVKGMGIKFTKASVHTPESNRVAE